jgi:spermidine/putrescine transport system ATP-binding protein
MGFSRTGNQADTNAIAVEAQNITKVFGKGDEEVRALDDVSVTIRENEFFTLLGPSGCGKTTLLRLIAGFELPSDGQILLQGNRIGHLPPNKRPVNTVFQNYALFPHMTVAENIGFGLEMLGKPREEVEDTIKSILALVRMEQYGNRKTSQLSGGQQQRVALARALAPHPKVLLLDEPLSALDLKLRKEMQIELKRMQHETGITFVFVTHDQEEALTMSDRVAVMNEGKILQVGSPTDIYEHPTHRFVADFIGDTNFLEAKVISVEKDFAMVELESGVRCKATVPAGMQVDGKVSVAIRPEQVSLQLAAGENSLSGQIENIIYFGTDTICHLVLDGDVPFSVRLQNKGGARSGLEIGNKISVDIPDGALQVLRD